MTKSLKGLSSRNFITTNTVEEAFVGREAIAALRATTLSPADASLGDSGSLSDDVIYLDDGSNSEFVVLDCLDPKADDAPVHREERRHDLPPALRPALRSATKARSASRSAAPRPESSTSTATPTTSPSSWSPARPISSRCAAPGPIRSSDPLLQLLRSGRSHSASSADDDGGTRTNSLLTYTATSTGQHVIRAASFNNNPDALNLDTGYYTVDVRVQGVDAIGFTNATSVPLSLGTTFGFREYGTGNESPLPGILDGDTDRYSITLEAGHFYTFEVAAGWDGGASGSQRDEHADRAAQCGWLIVNGASARTTISAATSARRWASPPPSAAPIISTSMPATARPAATSSTPRMSISPASARSTRSTGSTRTISTRSTSGGVPTAYVYFGAAGEDFGEGRPHHRGLERHREGGRHAGAARVHQDHRHPICGDPDVKPRPSSG